MTASTQVQLVARPHGRPAPDDFRTVTLDLPPLAPGQVRVRNEFMSVDPYMRGRMNDAKSYAAPYALGETMTGAAVGRVVESAADGYAVGDAVLHNLGWRDVAQGPAAKFRVVPEPAGLPLSVHLGILGMTGYTAYVGLRKIAPVTAGETVFVSGAAGAVGTAVGQIARQLGAARVVGSAGSAAKVDLLTGRYGYDAAFSYKDAPVRDQLPAHVPGGVDVFFDNVGGEHLEAALDVMNRDGRVALCGAISAYNATLRAPGPDNLALLITQGLTLRGFTVGFHTELYADFVRDMSGWLASGAVVFDETVVDGIDHAVEAFDALMAGANVGKMVVRIG
ncbi:MAG: NADP-dependent oxidoreductase [Cellulomonas sp.]|nr:NADP-dependent oxidoreductase [Cellulomonas sp.]